MFFLIAEFIPTIEIDIPAFGAITKLRNHLAQVAAYFPHLMASKEEHPNFPDLNPSCFFVYVLVHLVNDMELGVMDRR